VALGIFVWSGIRETYAREKKKKKNRVKKTGGSDEMSSERQSEVRREETAAVERERRCGRKRKACCSADIRRAVKKREKGWAAHVHYDRKQGRCSVVRKKEDSIMDHKEKAGQGCSVALLRMRVSSAMVDGKSGQKGPDLRKVNTRREARLQKGRSSPKVLRNHELST